jgi:hypothetical protein
MSWREKVKSLERIPSHRGFLRALFFLWFSEKGAQKSGNGWDDLEIVKAKGLLHGDSLLGYLELSSGMHYSCLTGTH